MNDMISVICPCYNAGRNLENLITSVLDKDFMPLELIIVDGMSSDKDTLEVLHRYADNERVAIIRETDRGLYDAMNKGIRHAKGEWLYFIGADDKFMLDNKTVTETDASIVIGRAVLDGIVHSYSYDWRMYFENTLLHQAVLYRRQVFKDFRYMPDYTVSSDYELNLHLYIKGEKAHHVNDILCEYSTAGVSSNVRWPSYREEIEIRKRQIHNPLLASLLSIYTVMRFCARKTYKTIK